MKNETIPDKITRKEYDRLIVLWKYRRSITLDQLFIFFGIVAIFVPAVALFGDEGFVMPVVMGILFIFASIMMFLSDFVFRGRSLGKRIMKLDLVSTEDRERISLHDIVYRRILEIGVNSIFRKSFNSKAGIIEHETKTKIIIYTSSEKNKD